MFNWFRNLSLRWKVLFAPGFLILVLIGVGAFTAYEQRVGQQAVDKLMTGPVRQAETVADFANSAWTSQVHLYRLMATAANETDQKKIKALGGVVAKALGTLAEKLKALDDPAYNNGDTVANVGKLKTAVASYITQAKGIIDMAESDAGTALMMMMGAARSFAVIEKIADELTDSSKEFRDIQIARNNQKLEQQQKLLIVILLIAVVVGCVQSVLVGRGISKPIVALVPELDKLANCEFDITLNGLGRKDEIGQISSAIQMVVEKVGSTIGNIKIAATEVTSASAEISTSTTDLSQRTEEQAASLEETSASMEQISSTVKKNAENATQANEFAAETNAVAARGGAVVSKAVTAMAHIEESSRKISDIIGVIDEIARQTNLLALNAAVEAARAGEAGRGFAVVASEVRSLAQRSSQAAKDIKDLINNSHTQVQSGVELVNKAGESLNEIVASIKKVAGIVADIASASVEQSTGIDQINKALTQMDEVTQQNSALVEENAATAKTLEDQAKTMGEQVAVFRLRSGTQVEAVARPTRPVVEKEGPAKSVSAEEPEVATPIRRASHTRKAPAGGRSGGGPVGRMQTALATAVSTDPDWKEF